jgi:hypothetical protein
MYYSIKIGKNQIGRVMELHVYSCDSDHLMCETCKDKCTDECPVCRQNFRVTPPRRNRLAEKMLEKLSTKNPDLGSGEADTFWRFFSLGHIFHIKNVFYSGKI